MAITPKQAATFTPDENAEADRMEAQIDRAIQDGYTKGDCRITIAASLFKTSCVRQEIIRRYQAAGWKVEYTDDQRDGDFLTFSPAESLDQVYNEERSR